MFELMFEQFEAACRTHSTDFAGSVGAGAAAAAF